MTARLDFLANTFHSDALVMHLGHMPEFSRRASSTLRQR